VGQGQRLRHRPYQQCLAEARHAFDQHVAGRDQRDGHLLDDCLLADQRLADCFTQPAE
jgi:hypothetical protein